MSLRSRAILALLLVTAAANVSHVRWASGAGTGSFHPTQMRVSVIAGQAKEGYFPVTVLNAEGFSGSLANVQGLVPGRQDLSKSLLSHATVIGSDRPLEISAAPVLPSEALTRTSQYRCKLLALCTLTVSMSKDADSSTVLTGFQVKGTDTFFLVPVEWVK